MMILTVGGPDDDRFPNPWPPDGEPKIPPPPDPKK